MKSRCAVGLFALLFSGSSFMKKPKIAMFFLGIVVLVGFFQAAASHAQFESTDPNFEFMFGDFVALSDDSHYDTYKIIVGKPIQQLSLSMISSGDPSGGDMHLAGSEILLDLSSAFVLSTVNSSSELSFSAIFIPPLPAGEYLATKVVFGFAEGYVHNTIANASGVFADGQSFRVGTYAGFVPEPSSAMLCLIGGVLLLQRRRKTQNG